MPQRLNRVAVRAGYHLARVLARNRYRVRIEIGRDDLARLAAANGSSSILMPNHPQPADWLILYLLSARLRHPYYFMTAHEQFAGSRRFWLPAFGTYSIRRGGWGDRGSVAQSLRLLLQPHGNLVIFPEGRCSFLSQDLLAFRPGAVKIGFNHLLHSQRQETTELLLLPLAICYQYIDPIFDQLEERIDRLQQVLSISTTGTRANGIDTLIQHVLASLEDQYRLRRTGAGWRQRIVCLCAEILRVSEKSLGIERAPRPGITDRACNIRQELALNGHRRGIADRVSYSEAYYPTLLALVLESFTEVDFAAPLPITLQADLVCSLERIVYRIPDPPPFARRRAVIRVGDAVNLSDWLDAYRLDRQGTCNKIIAKLQRGVARELSLAAKNSFAADSERSDVDDSTERPADPLSHG
jgi:hypothetical protein